MRLGDELRLNGFVYTANLLCNADSLCTLFIRELIKNGNVWESYFIDTT